MDKMINKYSFNTKYTDRLKSFDEFYAAYKGSAYTMHDEATQKKMLEQAWKLVKPKTEKQG